MIKVLVVEDSLVVQEFLVQILNADPEIQVVGVARNGEEALTAVAARKPDVITMDIDMPKMNGFEATRRIMETHPTPIVIVSGNWDPREISTTFQAVEAGAQAVLPRPRGVGHAEHEATARELVQTVKLMSEVKVIRRWNRQPNPSVIPPPFPQAVESAATELRIVAMGASTGGPLALQTILSALPKNFSLPVLLVQHIAPGFIRGFAEWLSQTSGFPVHVATNGDIPLPGHVYVAPDEFHMKVRTGPYLVLSQEEPEEGLRPSVAPLFRSVAAVFGQSAVGVLLTGMGRDGAEGLKLMRDRGAITFAQDQESSVVHGMPGAAIQMNAAQYVLSPQRIALMLASLVKTKGVRS